MDKGVDGSQVVVNVPLPWNWDSLSGTQGSLMARIYDVGQRPTQMCGN